MTKTKRKAKKPSTFKRLYAYFSILTVIFLVCAVIFTVIIATQWNAMLSDLPAGYVEVGVLLILDAVTAVQGIVWLVRLLKDGGRLKRNDALKIRGKVVGFQYEPYLQKNLSPVILAEGKRKALHTFNENMREGQTYDFLYLPSTGIAVVVGEAQTECDQNANAE